MFKACKTRDQNNKIKHFLFRLRLDTFFFFFVLVFTWWWHIPVQWALSPARAMRLARWTRTTPATFSRFRATTRSFTTLGALFWPMSSASFTVYGEKSIKTKFVVNQISVTLWNVRKNSLIFSVFWQTMKLAHIFSQNSSFFSLNSKFSFFLASVFISNSVCWTLIWHHPKGATKKNSPSAPISSIDFSVKVLLLNCLN